MSTTLYEALENAGAIAFRLEQENARLRAALEEIARKWPPPGGMGKIALAALAPPPEPIEALRLEAAAIAGALNAK